MRTPRERKAPDTEQNQSANPPKLLTPYKTLRDTIKKRAKKDVIESTTQVFLDQLNTPLKKPLIEKVKSLQSTFKKLTIAESKEEKVDASPQHSDQASIETIERELKEAEKALIKFKPITKDDLDEKQIETLKASIDQEVKALTNAFEATDHTETALTDDAKETYPIASSHIQNLITQFLQFKQKNGSQIEKIFYKDMTVPDFIDRLLKKRPLVFYNADDQYLLEDGTHGYGGFEAIGTPNEKRPLTLNNYLSYDEMQISALIGVSGPTHFINNGDRKNQGVPGRPGTYYADRAIYVGLVGARLEKPDIMEWQHVLVTKDQNTAANGYGKDSSELLKIWATFYGVDYFARFIEAEENPDRFIKINDQTYLDLTVYKVRMRMSIEAYLLEANERAKESGKNGYVHAVSLGTGAWLTGELRSDATVHLLNQLQLDVYREVIEQNALPHLSDIDFSYFACQADAALHCDPAPNNLVYQGKNVDYAIGNGGKVYDVNENHAINIQFSMHNPADPLTGVHAEKLRISSYAWDGNAQPGNEFWLGAFAASGDPAAACCSGIGLSQNSLINPTNVCGNRLQPFQSFMSDENQKEIKIDIDDVKIGEVKEEINYLTLTRDTLSEFSEQINSYPAQIRALHQTVQHNNMLIIKKQKELKKLEEQKEKKSDAQAALKRLNQKNNDNRIKLNELKAQLKAMKKIEQPLKDYYQALLKINEKATQFKTQAIEDANYKNAKEAAFDLSNALLKQLNEFIKDDVFTPRSAKSLLSQARKTFDAHQSILATHRGPLWGRLFKNAFLALCTLGTALLPIAAKLLYSRYKEKKWAAFFNDTDSIKLMKQAEEKLKKLKK